MHAKKSFIKALCYENWSKNKGITVVKRFKRKIKQKTKYI